MVRGEVFRLRAPRNTRGSEQRGSRYAVVVQADELLGLSTVLVAPTSTSATPQPFRPLVEIDRAKTLVMVEQTTAVDPGRLGESAGRLNASELRAVDEALTLAFGL